MSDDNIEKLIIQKGLTAPRITPDDIDNNIINDEYYVFPNTTVTICLLTLINGFTVTGESACASVENFNEEIGKEIAYSNAKQKIWALEGYLLKDRLYKENL